MKVFNNVIISNGGGTPIDLGHLSILQTIPKECNLLVIQLENEITHDDDLQFLLNFTFNENELLLECNLRFEANQPGDTEKYYSGIIKDNEILSPSYAIIDGTTMILSSLIFINQ